MLQSNEVDGNEPVISRVLPVVESPEVAQQQAEELFAALACEDDEAMTCAFIESDILALAERHGTDAAMKLIERASDRLAQIEAYKAKQAVSEFVTGLQLAFMTLMA